MPDRLEGEAAGDVGVFVEQKGAGDGGWALDFHTQFDPPDASAWRRVQSLWHRPSPVAVLERL